MLHAPFTSMILFLVLAAGLSALFILGKQARSHDPISVANRSMHRGTGGIALAADYFSGAALLGICGLIAFYGYDGFLYAIGLLAGWIAALLTMRRPPRLFQKGTFAKTPDSRFDARGVRLAAGISALVLALFFLMVELIGAGAAIKAVIGITPIPGSALGAAVDGRLMACIVLAGIVLIAAVTIAGKGSTRWGPFVRGALLFIACGALTLMVWARGFTPRSTVAFPRIVSNTEFASKVAPLGTPIATPPGSPWALASDHFYRLKMKDGSISTWLVQGQGRNPPMLGWPSIFIECETASTSADGHVLVNGKPRSAENELKPVNFVESLPDGVKAGSPLGPRNFLSTLLNARVAAPGTARIARTVDGKPGETVVYYPRMLSGADVLTPGQDPTLFPGLASKGKHDPINFLSLMLALFCGTAALPHILSRFYMAGDETAARKSAIVAVILIALFFMMTLYLGLGAMTTGRLDPSDSNSAVLLLAKGFGSLVLVLFGAIVFLAALGAGGNRLIAASSALVHHLPLAGRHGDSGAQASAGAGKPAAIIAGLLGIALALIFERMNLAVLIGWGMAIAGSANLPAITMLRFWKRTTRQGIAASIVVGLISSVAWILLSSDAFANVYGLPAGRSPLPFDQPALVTIPLSYLTLIAVSLVTSTPKLRGGRPHESTTAG